MTAGNDFYRGSGLSVRNYHFKYSPLPTWGSGLTLERAIPRSLAPGGPFGVPDRVVGQVWALLFSLPVSISHLSVSYVRNASLLPIREDSSARPRPHLFSF